MKILVTGSNGMVGTQLVDMQRSQGNEVIRLVRAHPLAADELYWEPAKSLINQDALEGFDAVVHLAGDNIASGRWTRAKKAAIHESRVNGTRLLSQALTLLHRPPRVFISASAIGYYGDRCDEILTEESTPGNGFLAQVCREWEAATDLPRQSGIRVANLRIGVVLSTTGGALPKMLLPFRMGAGGKIGSGKQYMSWISLTDLLRIIDYVLVHDNLDGAVNAVSPNPVTNDQFAGVLGSVLRRPTVLPMPGFAAHLLMGEMANELILASTLVKPAKLIREGFSFRHPDLSGMLRELLNVA